MTLDGNEASLSVAWVDMHLGKQQRQRGGPPVTPTEAELFDKAHRMLLEIKAEAWEEGFDAGEQDVWNHDNKGNWDEDDSCIPNPYKLYTWRRDDGWEVRVTDDEALEKNLQGRGYGKVASS